MKTKTWSYFCWHWPTGSYRFLKFEELTITFEIAIRLVELRIVWSVTLSRSLHNPPNSFMLWWKYLHGFGGHLWEKLQGVMEGIYLKWQNWGDFRENFTSYICHLFLSFPFPFIPPFCSFLVFVEFAAPPAILGRFYYCRWLEPIVNYIWEKNHWNEE